MDASDDPETTAKHERNQAVAALHRPSITIHGLPTEVLIDIFRFAFIKDSHTAMLRITHVCGRWRAVAVGTSNFWTTVVIRDIQRSIEMPDVYIERSKGVFLDFVVNLPMGESEATSTGQALVCAIYVLGRYADRAQSLSGRLNASQWSTISRAVGEWPHLTSLDLTNDDTGLSGRLLLSGDQSDSEIGRPRMPALRHLVLTGFSLIGISPPAMAGLRSFTWKTASSMLYQLMRCLEYLTLLEELTITDTKLFGSRADPNQEPIHLTHLKLFTWSFPSCKQLFRFFQSIQTPNLIHLSLSFNFPVQGLDYERVALPNLRFFALIITHDSAMDCFQFFDWPRLTTVDLVYRDLTAGRFEPQNLLRSVLSVEISSFPTYDLEDLSVTGFAFTSELFTSMRLLSHLSSLRIDKCDDVEKLFRPLEKEPHCCPRLTQLYLTNIRFEDIGCLKRFVDLRTIPQNVPGRSAVQVPRKEIGSSQTGDKQYSPAGLVLTHGELIARVIVTLHLINCDGVDEGSQVALRAAVGDFKFVF